MKLKNSKLFKIAIIVSIVTVLGFTVRPIMDAIYSYQLKKQHEIDEETHHIILNETNESEGLQIYNDNDIKLYYNGMNDTYDFKIFVVNNSKKDITITCDRIVFEYDYTEEYEMYDNIPAGESKTCLIKRRDTEEAENIILHLIFGTWLSTDIILRDSNGNLIEKLNYSIYNKKSETKIITTE